MVCLPIPKLKRNTKHYCSLRVKYIAVCLIFRVHHKTKFTILLYILLFYITIVTYSDLFHVARDELPYFLSNALASIFFFRDKLFTLFETVTSKETIEPATRRPKKKKKKKKSRTLPAHAPALTS